MLLVYAVVLVCSASVFGLYVRIVLWHLGFIPSFATSVLIVFGAACAYAAVQLLFMAVMRFAQPTTAPSTYITEIVSNAFVLVLVPVLLNIRIGWSNDVLNRVEPFLYLGVFVAAHAFFKLATFYASLQSPMSKRVSGLGWFGAALLCALLAFAGIARGVVAAEAARPEVRDEPAYYRVGDQYALAYRVPEGSVFELQLPGTDDIALTYRLGLLPAEAGQDSEVDTAYVTVTTEGAATRPKLYRTATRLSSGEWSEITVPLNYMPPGLDEASFRWTRNDEPKPYQWLQIRPIVYNLPTTPGAEPPPPARLLVSGPYLHATRPESSNPNVIVIVIDGLASNHLTMLGYRREVSPSLDRLGINGLVFANAYSPSADPVDAVRSILEPDVENGAVGRGLVDALNDGYYLTAAFTEGENAGAEDLVFDSGIERGFELLDPSYQSVTDPTDTSDGETNTAEHQSGGSRATLVKVQAWIQEHRFQKFFLLVRLRELEDPQWREEFDDTFADERSRASDADVFDSALLHLDRRIGALIRFIRNHEEVRNTVFVVTAPYGHTFGLADGDLREPTLRVPIIVNAPGMPKRTMPDKTSLAAIAPTIARLTDTDLDESAYPEPLLR